MLAVEPSKRLVHRTLMARMPEALEATLHPDATRAVAEFFLHSMVGTREAGRVMPQCVMPFAGASPPITGVAHRMEALPRIAISLRVEVGRNRSSRAPFWGKQWHGVTVIAKVISLKYHEPVHNRADLPRAGTHVFAPELQVAL